MVNSKIFEKVQIICREVFKEADLEIKESTNSKDIEGWDSLSNLFLIDSIEKEFKVKFTLDEILSSKNIGDLILHIEKKTNV